MMKPVFQIKKILFYHSILAVCSLTLVINLASSYAEAISSAELISNARKYNGKSVVYEGEVIGDLMARGEYAWANIKDSGYAIGIWAPVALLKAITYTGSYKFKGDWVEVNGIFNRACPVHGGDLDIHAESIRKVSGGRQVQQGMNVSKKNFALVLLGVLLAVWILTLLIRR